MLFPRPTQEQYNPHFTRSWQSNLTSALVLHRHPLPHLRGTGELTGHKIHCYPLSRVTGLRPPASAASSHYHKWGHVVNMPSSLASHVVFHKALGMVGVVWRVVIRLPRCLPQRALFASLTSNHARQWRAYPEEACVLHKVPNSPLALSIFFQRPTEHSLASITVVQPFCVWFVPCFFVLPVGMIDFSSCCILEFPMRFISIVTGHWSEARRHKSSSKKWNFLH